MTAVRSPSLAPFSVRSFRFQWPADLATSWAIEMEVLILGWYVLVESGSVMLRSAHEEFLSRVMGMRILAIMGLPLGMLVSGPVIRAIGFTATSTVFSIAGFCITAFVAVRWRAVLWSKSAKANRSA